MGTSASSNNQAKNPNPRSKTSFKLPEESRQMLEEWMTNVPFSLTSSQKQVIFDAVHLLDVEAPKTLIRKGDDVIGIFIVLSGKIEVVHEGHVIREVPNGDCFGEVSLMYGTKCTADVRAVSRASLLLLKAQEARQLFTLPPEITILDWFVKRKYVDTSGLFPKSKLSQEIALITLQKAPIFQGWREITLKQIVESLKERPLTMYPAGSLIYSQEVTGWEIYLLVHGRVQFSTNNQDLVVFDASDQGFCFGEEGFFGNTKRRSSVRALSTCQIIMLEAKNFYDVLSEHPAENTLFQMIHHKWKEHIEKRNNDLYKQYGGALDLEILRMALKQTDYLKGCPSGFVYSIALSTVVKEIQEEQAILSHKQYSQGNIMFVLLKGSAILVNDEQNTEEYLEAKQVFRKLPSSPPDAWIKANEISVVAFFPKTAIKEALDAFPYVVLE
ncbi:cGMP-dependent protein kinase 1-like [Actinia tenebrosa]|uniref:cGMP-dependent protein kinase 1-like n=1 Tax=Actinia tenebrosa TaxID=6105 RepID=A0A6P8IL06_ACTTE|nr:cGMP-dependent protein kinase 1-like [Actinia tenebrosa]